MCTCRMDFIRKYDIELEKEQYYAGEMLRGWVVIENAENLRITGTINHGWEPRDCQQRLLTSSEEVMRAFAFVCLFVCV